MMGGELHGGLVGGYQYGLPAGMAPQEAYGQQPEGQFGHGSNQEEHSEEPEDPHSDDMEPEEEEAEQLEQDAAGLPPAPVAAGLVHTHG